MSNKHSVLNLLMLWVLLILLVGLLGPPAAWANPPANPSTGSGQAPSTGSGQAPSTGSGPRWEKIDPALRELMEAQPHGVFDVIVEIQDPPGGGQSNRPAHAKAHAAQQLIRSHGGEAGNSLALIGGASGRLNGPATRALSHNPRVAYIAHNRTMFAQGVAAQGSSGLASTYTEAVRAPEVWALGYTGQGVTVAVLDSGVAPSNDLQLPTARLLASVDLVDNTAPGFTDPGGHGTHVAGIIAGNGYDSAGEPSGAYQGIAPGANIVSVRVIDDIGTASVARVIRGIQWVVENRDTYNIRVINLSLGAPPSDIYLNDPLSTAVEIAWHAGIVIVTSAGNDGPTPGTISTPGRDPYGITVGAVDDGNTPDTGDDVVPDWSARGPTYDGLHKPDVVAPGRRIVSLHVPGSYLDNLLPERVTPLTNADATYFRLSGTSMSAPVVSGVVALMLERNPNLRPDRVKFILDKEAQSVLSISGDGRDVVGAGLVDAHASVTSPLIDKANKGKRPSNGFARMIKPLIYGQPLTWHDPWLNGIDWDNLTWDNLTWDNLTWDNLIWENLIWDNLTWDNLTWDNLTWDTTWETLEQDSVPWDTLVSLD